MHPPTLRMLSFLVVFTRTGSLSSTEEQCMGYEPMESVATFMGMNLDYDLSDRICCHNHRYAEPWGYHASYGVDFYSKLDPETETVFYDSVCGIPLFVAPRGRTFEQFVEESLKHGWPSFRPEELVSENVIIHDDGRMESKCLTHLGHNLPDGDDRYCIDLVCIAGDPSFLLDVGGDFLATSEFNATTYVSSAELQSGKYPKTKERIILAAIIVSTVVVIASVGQLIRKHLQNRKVLEESKAPESKILS